MNTQKGLSLITIFVIIAILAVAAAVGVPAWQTHRINGHVSEALKAADAAKLVVMEAATTSGGLARIRHDDLGYNAQATANPYVASVVIADEGKITLTTRNTGASPDPVLQLIPGGSPITWHCSILAGAPRMAPAECREDASAPLPGNTGSTMEKPAASATTASN